MGQSTDAYLFFGYCWNDEIDLLHNDPDDESEWYEIIAKREGNRNPWDLYRMSGAEAEHSRLPYAEQSAAYQAWKEEVGFEQLYAEWKAVTEEVKSRYNGIDISSHCSCEYPMPYIYIVETEHRAWRGQGVQLDMEQWEKWQHPRSFVTWNEDLARFTADLGIDLSNAEGPGWFLVINWC